MSNETKWTPGPWYADAIGQIWRRPLSELYEYGGSVGGDKPVAYASVGWWHEGAEGYPREANAHLIAAAPELYEALKQLLAGWRYAMTFIERQCDLDGVGWKSAENKAEAALAKARGEQ